MSRLSVIVDGEPMPEAEAREFWKRFSAWMEKNKGDLGGFAKSEGFASVRPEQGGGKAVLVVSRSAAQTPYTTATQHKSKRRGN
jgi:hypothetical protein